MNNCCNYIKGLNFNQLQLSVEAIATISTAIIFWPNVRIVKLRKLAKRQNSKATKTTEALSLPKLTTWLTEDTTTR